MDVRYRHVRLPGLGRNAAITAKMWECSKYYGVDGLTGVSFAFCSQHDQFDKDEGRKISTNKKRGYYRVVMSKDDDGRPDVDGTVVKALRKAWERNLMPTWFKRYVRRVDKKLFSRKGKINGCVDGLEFVVRCGKLLGPDGLFANGKVNPDYFGTLTLTCDSKEIEAMIKTGHGLKHPDDMPSGREIPPMNCPCELKLDEIGKDLKLKTWSADEVREVVKRVKESVGSGKMKELADKHMEWQEGELKAHYVCPAAAKMRAKAGLPLPVGPFIPSDIERRTERMFAERKDGMVRPLGESIGVAAENEAGDKTNEEG